MSIPKIIHYCWFGRNPKPQLADQPGRAQLAKSTVGEALEAIS